MLLHQFMRSSTATPVALMMTFLAAAPYRPAQRFCGRRSVSDRVADGAVSRAWQLGLAPISGGSCACCAEPYSMTANVKSCHPRRSREGRTCVFRIA